jgi:hypothetical protein
MVDADHNGRLNPVGMLAPRARLHDGVSPELQFRAGTELQFRAGIDDQPEGCSLQTLTHGSHRLNRVGSSCLAGWRQPGVDQTHLCRTEQKDPSSVCPWPAARLPRIRSRSKMLSLPPAMKTPPPSLSWPGSVPVLFAVLPRT